MSKIVYQSTIPLSMIVTEADFILLVQQDSAKSSSIGEMTVDSNLPPFKYEVDLFEITEVLYGSYLSKGNLIKVVEGELGRKIDVFKQYHSKGIQKSLIQSAYENYLNVEVSDSRIIFVRTFDDSKYQYVCSYAFESVDKKKEILDLIKEIRKS